MSYAVEVSNDLASWTTATVSEVGVVLDTTVAGVIERVTVEYATDQNAPMVFARLRVGR